MESLFAVLRPNKTLTDWAENDLNLFKTLCSVSTCNIIAFTTTTETMDSNETSLGFHVYVADINTPWHSYKVTSNKFPISVVEWDILGKYLLIGDFSGNVQLWVQKDSMISEWTQLYAINFPGEHILKAVFFHNGKRIQLVPDKKDSYMEKFQRVKFSPSVRQFGGVPAEGCLIISFTGMLGAFLIPTEPPNIAQNHNNNNYNHPPYTLQTVTESLGLTRNFCTAADICYGKNGQFLVAVSNGEIKVQCYRVIVKKIDDRLTITSLSLPSFFLANDDNRDALQIEKLKWISQEDNGDSLVVAANHSSGSLIQIWSLIEKNTPIHKLFQTNKSEVFKTIDWSNQPPYKSNTKLMDICTSKLTFGNAPFIVIAMENFKVQCLHADTLREIAEDSLNFSWSDLQGGDQQRTKMLCYGSQIAAVDVTWMGQMMIQIDTKGQIYAHRLNFTNIDHHSSGTMEYHVLQLLEYCLVTGYDYIDILLNVKFQYLEKMVDILSDNFYRQPSTVQQYYYVNFITMKTNLYRLLSAGQAKAHDLTNLLMLHSILITFKSILRPSDLTCHDKGPAESLALVLSESVPDVDKVLLNIEAKDFTVEQFTLQSLQQLIQWVADLALNILAKLPESRCLIGPQMRNSGYDISKDLVALNSIRELLVIIRIWGLFKPQCLPVFSRSADNLDILSTLFRLFTRLALSPNEPDEILLDECCMLPSQVLIPQLQSPVINPRTGLLSPVLPYNNPPMKFTFGIEPESLKYCAELPIVEGGLSNDNMIDSVRHIQLGKQPKSIRKCSRCGACSNVSSIARTAALRAWEQRWGNRCLCGGFWALKVYNS